MVEKEKYSIFYRHKNIIDFEINIRNNDFDEGEMIAIFSETGELKCGPLIGLPRIIIDERECPDIRRKILTHNHISDSSFSGDDLKTASELQLREIRVVGKSGVFSMKEGVIQWPDSELIYRRYEEIQQSNELKAKLTSFLFDEKCTIHPMNHYNAWLQLRSDFCCEYLATEFGLEYQKSRWPDK